MKHFFLYIVYLFASSLLIVFLLEGIGRVLIHVKYGVPGKSYGLWKYDSELGATHRFNAYNTHTSTNNLGFRNKEDVFDPKPPGSLRIIAFGGSTTFGYNLADGETYTELLEHKIRNIPGYEKSQVLNAGRICYSAGHNLILMRRLVPFLKPDYIILYEGINEIQNEWALKLDGVNLDKLGSTYGALGKSYDQNRWLKRNSVIVRFIDYRVKTHLPRLSSKSNPLQAVSLHPWIIENYKFLLRQMIDFLLENKVTPIVLKYASIGRDDLKTLSRISAEIAQEKGVLICNMDSRFHQFGGRTKDLFIDTGVHVTPKGAEILADELFQVIVKDLKQRSV